MLPQNQICQIGCTLYAALGDPRTFPNDPNSILIYKSTDGVNWTLLDFSHSPLFGLRDGGVQNSLSVNNGIIYSLGGVAVGSPSPPYDTFDAASNIKYWNFDPSTGLWGSKTSLTAVQTDSNDFLSVNKFFGAFRPDGSYILTYMINHFPPQIIVRKRSIGGTWSTLATFSDTGPIGVIFQSALMIADGTLYILAMFADSGDGHGSLRVATVSPTDTVSGMMLVEDNVTAANQGLSGGNFVGVGDYNGTVEIAFSYPASITSFFNAYGDIHVARGNISVTPLAPTWTIDTAVSGSSSTPSYPNPQMAVAYIGNDIHLYWTRSTNANPALGTDALLYRAIKSGTWGSPSLIYTDTRGANGQLEIIKYNSQIGILWAVQGFGAAFQGSSSICPAVPLNISISDTFNLGDSGSPLDSLLVIPSSFFPSDCGHGNLIVESDDIPVNPGLGPGCGGGYDSLVEAD
jgi:hypothetical protein